MKRKKILEKGIASIEKEIKLHEKKLEDARKKVKDEGILTYMEKDLERLRKQKKRKEERV